MVIVFIVVKTCNKKDFLHQNNIKDNDPGSELNDPGSELNDPCAELNDPGAELNKLKSCRLIMTFSFLLVIENKKYGLGQYQKDISKLSIITILHKCYIYVIVVNCIFNSYEKSTIASLWS